MSRAFKCDRCKQFSDGVKYILEVSQVIDLKFKDGECELCEECRNKLTDFLNGVELTECTLDEQDNETDETTYEIKPLIYHSYNSHDCETFYKCPYCNETIGDWSLFHQERDPKKPHCPKCNKLVDYKVLF